MCSVSPAQHGRVIWIAQPLTPNAVDGFLCPLSREKALVTDLLATHRSQASGTKARFTRRQMLALSAANVLSACSNESPESKAPFVRPNIIVFLADALRADHLGCYGHTVATSPALDRFSKQSVVFEQCYSQAPWTKPSIASISTGLLPRVHQAGISHWDVPHLHDFPVQRLRDRFVTLAEALKEVGYHTAMFLANPMVQAGFGFEQGFDLYRYLPGAPRRVVDAALKWLTDEAREPFFLFIHEIDPHGPYTPADEVFEELFAAPLKPTLDALPAKDRQLLQEFRGFYANYQQGKVKGKPNLSNLSPPGLEYLRHLYDAEIAGADRLLDQLLGHLEAANTMQRTVVVFTSDHGEAFNEHRNFGHGKTVFDEEIHVPLVIRPPGRSLGHRVPWTVSLYDLYPTLVTLAGGSVPSYVQARTLLDQDGGLVVSRDRRVFSDLDHYVAETDRWDSCMVEGAVKVMTQGNGKWTAFYDRAADPTEDSDLAGKATRRGSRLRRSIKVFEAEGRKHLALAESFGQAEWTTGTQQQHQDLGALGYL